MEFSCHFEGVEQFELDESALIRDLSALVDDFGLTLGDLSLVFCSDDYILCVNREYLQHDYYTDVITFDYSLDNIVSGDIIISIETVASNADLYGVVYQEELFRVVLHGVLHLCGLGDKNDTEIVLMRAKETYYLNQLTNPF